MEQSIKQKYKLPKEEHERIYKKIEHEVFHDLKPDKKPIAIIVGGQPGSGKGAVISASKKEVESTGKCIIIITTDEYKPYHPNAIEIAKKYPTEYVEIVEQDAGSWTGKVLKKAIDEKYNFIFEGTLKTDRILDRIKELQQNGFQTVVRALAVPRIESLIAIHERYQNQMQNMGWGRLVSIEHHNKAYDGVPIVIDKIEKSGLCTVEIFIRGKEISKPKRVYSSLDKNGENINARMVLESYRISEASKTVVTAKRRIETLKEQFKVRNASEEEMKQLEVLEEYIDQNQEKEI